VVWNSGLINYLENELEKIQKVAMKIILSEHYTSYELVHFSMLPHSALDGQTFVVTMPLSCTKAIDVTNSLHPTVLVLKEGRRNW